MKINLELGLLLWFICFGLSFLFQNIGIVDQGTAFVYIYTTILIAFFVIIAIVLQKSINSIENATTTLDYGWLSRFFSSINLSFLWVVILMSMATIIGLIFLCSWGFCKIFNVEFSTTFQILTFGMSLQAVSSNSKNK